MTENAPRCRKCGRVYRLVRSLRSLLFWRPRCTCSARYQPTKRSSTVPPRHLWPRLKQPQSARPECDLCGSLYRAVSTQGAITYYGPCCVCRKRRLKKVERPIDWESMHVRFVVPMWMRPTKVASG